MSHHLDTPLASQTGQLYLDDLYVFPGASSTVFVMDVNSNVNGLFSEPGFHPEARYELKVHFDGADFEALTYRVSFAEAGSGGQQALHRYARDLRVCRLQRPDAGRQRTRGHAVPGRRHRRAVRTEAVHSRASAGQQLPLRRA